MQQTTRFPRPDLAVLVPVSSDPSARRERCEVLVSLVVRGRSPPQPRSRDRDFRRSSVTGSVSRGHLGRRSPAAQHGTTAPRLHGITANPQHGESSVSRKRDVRAIVLALASPARQPSPVSTAASLTSPRASMYSHSRQANQYPVPAPPQARPEGVPLPPPHLHDAGSMMHMPPHQLPPHHPQQQHSPQPPQTQSGLTYTHGDNPGDYVGHRDGRTYR